MGTVGRYGGWVWSVGMVDGYCEWVWWIGMVDEYGGWVRWMGMVESREMKAGRLERTETITNK